MGEVGSTVVVGWNSSSASVRALHWAAAVATARQGRLVCVTVEPAVPVHALFGGVPVLSFGETSIVNAVEVISSLAGGAVPGTVQTIPDTACVAVRGDVASGLDEVARERAADLVVIGAPGRRARWRGRSLSDRLVGSLPCPLVVVP